MKTPVFSIGGPRTAVAGWTRSHSNMPDPTESVIIATFCTAFGIFSLTAISRALLGKNPEPPAEGELRIPEGDSPYQPPSVTEAPSPLPVGKVPVSFYRPLDLLGVGMIFLVFFTLVVGSVRMAGEKEVVLDPSGLISSITFQFITAGIVTALMLTRVRPIEWLGLRWKNWPWIFLIAPASVMTMWLIFGLLQASGFMEWIESLGVESVQDTVKLLQESNDPVLVGLMAFAAVFAAPFCEEIVFRGYLYPIGKRFAGPWAAGIASALIFAAAHGSVAALLPLFIFGAVLVFLYEKTGSLWAPIAVHFCFNGATVLVQLASRYYDIPLDATP